MAELEAVSVLAFQRMARELALLGAPSPLVAAAAAAALEESDHAAAMTRLAVARGAVVQLPVSSGAFEARSLSELTRENAREGCVREAFGAVLAAFGAVTAEDPAVRAVMMRVAEEEARHAQLSWDLHAWATSLLTSTERVAVEEETLGARRSLRDSLRERPEWGERVGLPTAHEMHRLLDGLEALLFPDCHVSG